MIFDPDEAVLAERANMARLVGSCIFSWSGVETDLTYLFGDAMGTDRERAFAVMEAVNSFEVRLDMADAALQIAIKDPHLLRVWDRLYNKLVKAAKARHQVAHSQIETTTSLRNGKTKVEVIPFYKVQTEAKSRLTESDLNFRRQRFWDLQQALRWMRSAILAGPDKRPTENEVVPDLVRELLNADAQSREDSERQPQSSRPSPETRDPD